MAISKGCCAPPGKRRSAPRPERLAGWLCALALAAASAQARPSPVIDNARVTVRAIALAPGRPVRLNHARDHLTLFLSGGAIRTGGASAVRAAGDAVYGHAGVETEEAVAGPLQVVTVDLNEDHPAPPLPNRTKYPLAFPRPGVKKVLENGRVIVWNYAWRPGRATPMHYHDKDVVVVYQGEGTLDSVTPDGKHVSTAHHAGEIRFNKGDRSHYELLTGGRQSAIMVELK